MKIALFGLAALACVLGCSSQPEDDVTQGAGDELVGGTPDLRWPAAGYLVHGATLEAAASAKVACGATLVAPNVVVTAAHCVLAFPDDVWAFGTGDADSSALVQIVSQRVHPDFHPAPESHFDTRYYLRNFDVATLGLETSVDVEPATLPEAKTPVSCNYSAIGYHTDSSAPASRVSTGACVEFRVELGGDPIFEVHPTGHSAICHGDGDEGSPLFGHDDHPVLHGIYVGSVTQGLTDCRAGTQYLNGYEAMFGFRDFVEESLTEAASR